MVPSFQSLISPWNKLDRRKAGGQTHCKIIKYDDGNAAYPQTMDAVLITAVEDDDYYTERPAGDIHELDVPK